MSDPNGRINDRHKRPTYDVVQNVGNARQTVYAWLDKVQLRHFVDLGLPEIDDRKNVWRVPLLVRENGGSNGQRVGEVVIDAATGRICQHTDPKILTRRIARVEAIVNHVDERPVRRSKNKRQAPPPFIPNKVVLGNADEVLSELPPNSVQLVFTSPPYYNARPEYTEYLDYQEYLDSLRRVFLRCHEVMSEGRFLAVNTSPVLIRRINRQSSSRRIAVPFDLHHIMTSIGFDFIDDIVWIKPEGAGWATGRGRRFAADRNPLQYKAVPVTEYILVYRKKTPKLIDWNIRTHHDPALVEASKITGDYDVTNVWHLTPSYHREHPAVFPDALAEKVIRYYSFVDDLVLDPFAGSGTVGRVALKMKRRFFLVDNEPEYFKLMRRELIPLAQDMGQEILFEPEDDEDTFSPWQQPRLF